MEEDEALPSHLRCNRTDGRQWRCNRRVMDNMKLCEIHYLQGRHRQYKQKVPESLKIERKDKNKHRNRDLKKIRNLDIKGNKIDKSASEAEKVIVRRKREIGVSKGLDEALKKMKRGDLQLELIREFLKRKVRKRKEKESNREDVEELVRKLPNGVMAITPSLSPQKLDNVGCFNVKLGLNSKHFTRRCFRSKNIEPIPIGTMQVVPYAQNMINSRRRKRNKCHWCKRSTYGILIKCSSCQKQFFCVDCINERYLYEKDVRNACPICCQTCNCRACMRSKSKDVEQKEIWSDKRKVEKIQQLHYLMYLLLPVLKQINQEQSIELEIEAKKNGKAVSEVQLCQVELGYKRLYCCNNCKTSIVDFHRSCKICSYALCLKCCREFFQANSHRIGKKFKSKYPDGTSADKPLSKGKQTNKSMQRLGIMHHISPMLFQNWKACSDGSISCPPENLGGCGNSLLNLRCMFPFNWTKELEVCAEEIICSYDFPGSSDASSCCSLCTGRDCEAGRIKVLKGIANKESKDDFLFYPTRQDLLAENLAHFQKHWGTGHPVIVRNVLQTTSQLSWDPVGMFCTYLEKSSMKSRTDKAVVKATSCSDWCEVELGIKQIFLGSLGEQTHANMWQEMLKIKCWLSSDLFQEQFPDHYAEIIHALPLKEYLNPFSGLLNLALQLPQEMRKPDLGPILYISYSGQDEVMKGDFQTKLCYDSYDMVNILAHTAEIPISAEQLSKIKNLMKMYNSQNNESTRNAVDNRTSEVKEQSSLHRQCTGEFGWQGMLEEGLHLANGAAKASLHPGNSQKDCSSSNNINIYDLTEQDLKFNSEASILYSRMFQSSDDQSFFQDDIENSTSSGERLESDSCAAEWDIFRREDVPRLLEYLRRHSKEFNHTYCSPKHIVHPILDQSFFLDAFHKMRLKEEFDIEPWSFEQHTGEAIMIPAGCPYQIRKLKPCVNIIVDFISPESIAECINLTDELRQLPLRHNAKGKMLEVSKMAVYGINTALQEIHGLLHPEENA